MVSKHLVLKPAPMKRYWSLLKVQKIFLETTDLVVAEESDFSDSSYKKVEKIFRSPLHSTLHQNQGVHIWPIANKENNGINQSEPRQKRCEWAKCGKSCHPPAPKVVIHATGAKSGKICNPRREQEENATQAKSGKTLHPGQKEKNRQPAPKAGKMEYAPTMGKNTIYLLNEKGREKSSITRNRLNRFRLRDALRVAMILSLTSNSETLLNSISSLLMIRSLSPVISSTIGEEVRLVCFEEGSVSHT